MSRSAPNLSNPSSHFLEWKNGKLAYWDKELQKSVEVKLPYSFLPIDQLHTVTGYSDADESGFWANEARTTKAEFNVRTKKGTRYVGPYKNEQGIVQLPTGARYTKSVYIVTKEAGGYAINNLKLTGAALTAWIELTGKHNVESGKVTLTGSTEGKKGATTYHIPTFEYTNATKEEDEAATALDRDLQVYLSQYLVTKDEPEHEDAPTGDSYNTSDGKASPEQIARFEKLKADKLKPLDVDDFPDRQDDYNRIAEVFGDGSPIPEEPEGY
jgi:hypothetical protein